MTVHVDCNLRWTSRALFSHFSPHVHVLQTMTTQSAAQQEVAGAVQDAHLLMAWTTTA